MFKLVSEYKPTGDQPKAIDYLVKGIQEGKKYQTLLGVTGSRKNIYYGKYNRKSAKANTGFGTQQNSSWTVIFRIQRVFPTVITLNTLSVIMTTTNQKVI